MSSVRPTVRPSVRRLKQLRTFEVSLSRNGFGPVAGVDEAGRGACCGPISIAACILPDKPIEELSQLTDSKKLSAPTREKLMPLIKKHALAWSVILISAQDIDKFGIQHANISGMRRAIAALEIRPGYVLTDAMKIPGLTSPHLPIIGGDASARCIAAASVIAKQTRDDLLTDMATTYPHYGLEIHKGYSTKIHMDAVRQHGASREHRYSYANVAKAHEDWLRSTDGETTEGGA